jgi:hypothetical protein
LGRFGLKAIYGASQLFFLNWRIDSSDTQMGQATSAVSTQSSG